jgi:hypothetical protein
MTAYPPEWAFHDEIDSESFHLAPRTDEGMGMAVLANVDWRATLPANSSVSSLEGAPAPSGFPPHDHIKDLV